jgi:hemerythrin
MALFNWSQKYSVGVKTLDDQHAVFISGINELHAAMMKGQGQTVAGPLLSKLLDGARNHFSTEEELMTSTKYPGLANHRLQHQDLLKTVEEYVARHKKEDKSMYIPLLNFLRDWQIKHMQQVDHEYVSWFSEHGVR